MAQTSKQRSATNAARQRQQTVDSQEITLGSVKDPDRRARCKLSPVLFVGGYFAKTVFRGLAPYQGEMVDAFRAVILDGGKKCRAVRRGGLKTTLALILALWAILYGHRRFLVLVGATDDKSNELRDNLFRLMATSKELLADFPELAPLIAKWKRPHKPLAYGGEPLLVSAKDERGCILFPNLPDVECSSARIASYSISATDVSGLVFVDDDGRMIRPDLLIFDDVQTPQSAKSFMQTENRENAVSTTFMGLAGLGETMAAIMVCTAREANDLTARFCDREKHPDWDGQKFPVLISEPDSKEAKLHWAAYSQKLREGATPADGFKLATAYYVEHRDEMDAGGVVAWDQDKEAAYVSALQWCMTIKFLQPEFFRCELQQEGTAPRAGLVQLSADALVKRLSRVPRGVIPAAASFVTAFIDSSDHVLWWMVCAWQRDFTGWIVDYGTWPDQGRSQFYKTDLVATIGQQLPGTSWEQAFVHAHNKLEQQIISDWDSETGQPRGVDLLLKDWSDGGQKPRIEAQIRTSIHKTRIRPSKGFAPKPGRKPVHAWGDLAKDRAGSHWIERRENPAHIQFDANQFKNMASHRLRTEVGAPSCLLLPGSDERAHTLLAEHFTAEQSKSLIYDGTPGTVWEAIPGRENDWWDCLVGNLVAAASLGCGLPGEIVKPTHQQRRVVNVPAHLMRNR